MGAVAAGCGASVIELPPGSIGFDFYGNRIAARREAEPDELPASQPFKQLGPANSLTECDECRGQS